MCWHAQRGVIRGSLRCARSGSGDATVGGRSARWPGSDGAQCVVRHLGVEHDDEGWQLGFRRAVERDMHRGSFEGRSPEIMDRGACRVSGAAGARAARLSRSMRA